MVRLRFVSLIALAAMLMAACGSATSVTSTTVVLEDSFASADGVEVSIDDTSRIVSLNGDLTEIIFALGAGEQVVGVDLTTTFPPDAATLPDVGLGRDLNAEQVIRLEPTLVIGDDQVQPAAAIDQIRRAGIPVVILPAVVALEGVQRKILTVGAILGLEVEAEALAQQVQSEIDEAVSLAADATSSPRVAYVYVRGPETLLLFGNGMATHFLIEAAHAVDAAGEVGVLFAENLSAERLVTASPEVLLTPTAGFEIIGGLDAFLALPGVADTPAGAARQVIAYDEALFLGMGPRVGVALRQLVVDLHPGIDG